MSWYTPGPWAFDGNGDVYAGDPEQGTRIDVCASGLGQDELVANANARLIALAPDMLALLIESQDWTPADWRQRRDAIVAKATGREA